MTLNQLYEEASVCGAVELHHTGSCFCYCVHPIYINDDDDDPARPHQKNSFIGFLCEQLITIHICAYC